MFHGLNINQQLESPCTATTFTFGNMVICTINCSASSWITLVTNFRLKIAFAI